MLLAVEEWALKMVWDRGFAMDPLRDPSNILSQRSVYFDFDSYTVKNEYRELLAHARYLRDNTNARVLL